MESCSVVENEIDKVLFKFNCFNEYSTEQLKVLYKEIEELQKEIDIAKNMGEIEEFIENPNSSLKQTIAKVKEVVSSVSSEHRELHSSVSKIGKVIDKSFTSDFLSISHENFLKGDKEKLINEVVSQHFFREGLLNVAETLLQEANVNLTEDDQIPFFELNEILASLNEKNLDLCLQWAIKHREKLTQQKSNLEFKLHRLAYIDLVSQGPDRIVDAINYAKLNLTAFVSQHEKAIQTLLGCLLYVKTGLLNSPYVELLGASQWVDICETFTRDACTLLGLSVDSPLTVCVRAGCTALPVLLNIKQVMQQQQVHNMWNAKDELPIEIDLGSNCRYHSIFACPILRQQSTENNPPMRLICGHIISRDALNKLTNANKLKCPYCPVEQNPSEATHVYF